MEIGSLVPVLLVVAGITACVVATVVAVARDGYGSNPPPRSHPRDEFEPDVARRATSLRRTRSTSPAVAAVERYAVETRPEE